MKTAIDSDLTLKAIKCRRAALLDGRHWTTAKQSAFSWRIHEDPAASQIYLDSGELFGKSLGRTERRQLTEALRRLEADGKIEAIKTGDRTVAVVLLVDPSIDDAERQRFDEWRRQFGRLSIDAVAAKQVAIDAERQRQAAIEAEDRRQRNAEYAERWKRPKQTFHSRNQ